MSLYIRLDVGTAAANLLPFSCRRRILEQHCIAPAPDHVLDGRTVGLEMPRRQTRKGGKGYD